MSTEVIGLACIAVGTGSGGTIAMLARVSLVDRRGDVLYDTFVLPNGPIVSYRETTTGLDGSFFADAQPFSEVQIAVAAWIKDKVVVGHQIWTDLQILGLSHPAIDTRDLSLFLPFRKALGRLNDIVGLTTLMWLLMRRKIQQGFVDSLENARAAMDLYRSHEKDWEACVAKGQWPCALPPPGFHRCYT